MVKNPFTLGRLEDPIVATDHWHEGRVWVMADTRYPQLTK